jgi:hypothetical protein
VRRQHFADLEEILMNHPIVAIRNGDETSVGSMSTGAKMEGREIKGCFTAKNATPTFPKANFGSGNTSFFTMIGCDIDDVQSETIRAADEQPALFIFTGEESAPMPNGERHELFEKLYSASSPGGGMTKELFAHVVEHILVPDLLKQRPDLKKGIM